MTRAEERKRATELKAVDVRELLRTSLPDVRPQLTSAHVDQLQRVLDAAVINADIEERGAALDRQAIKGRSGPGQYLRDPAGVAVRDKVLKQKIAVKPDESVVRLDFHKLLTADALKPASDNPDEAAYLLLVADVYEHRGVWLLLDSSMGAMTQKMHASDPRKWRVRLILGYKPGLIEEIETSNGSLNRRALLSVTRIGAGYYEWVHLGPTEKALKKALNSVESQISLGRSEHFWWSAHRNQFPVVSKVSDKLGVADWPKESIWDQPHKLYLQAWELLNAGKLIQAAKRAELASLSAGWCATAVHEYINATIRGGSRAVKILGVAEFCGKIAEGVLALLSLGQGLIRLLSRKGAANAVGAGGQRQLTGGQRQLPPGEPVPAPGPGGGSSPGGGGSRLGGGGTIGESPVPVKPGPPGSREWAEAFDRMRQRAGLPAPTLTLQGGVAEAEYALLQKAQKELFGWLRANPNAHPDQMGAVYDQIKARLGLIPR